jgi:Domain of unknown function DUF29
MLVKTDLKQLYEIDDHLWLEETVKLLKEKRFEELDLDNLIEELEALSRSDRNKAVSLLEQVIRHFLLLEYWSEESQYNSHHWEAEIDSFRTQLRRHLTTNLRNYLAEELEVIYQDARRYVTKKSRLQILPPNCPYSLAQLLDEDFLPSRED